MMSMTRRTAIIPVMYIPSNVPAPPMLTKGEPNRETLSRFSRSAPTSVPKVPATYAMMKGLLLVYIGKIAKAAKAEAKGGTKDGVALSLIHI